MKIAAYQFAVSGDMQHNFSVLHRAARQAAAQDVKLLVFPECALTGYPPRNIESSSAVDFRLMTALLDALGRMSMQYDMHIIAGTILPHENSFFNSAVILHPDGQRRFYHKRALWGWDMENFVPGNQAGVFEISGLKIGVRICYEVRFPEYFRELYTAQTDLNLVLFHDVSDADDPERYELIRAHLRTRAAENVCPILSVNAFHPFQTAPTALFDASGRVLCELERNAESLLVYDFTASSPDFSEQGRKQISDSLTMHN